MPASPQKEHGHLRIANELFEALILAHLCGTKRAVVDWVIRYTYGWFGKKETRDWKVRKIAEETAYAPGQISKALNNLLKMRILARNKKNDALGIQKDYQEWVLPHGKLSTESFKTETGQTRNVPILKQKGSKKEPSVPLLVSSLVRARKDTRKTTKDIYRGKLSPTPGFAELCNFVLSEYYGIRPGSEQHAGAIAHHRQKLAHIVAMAGGRVDRARRGIEAVADRYEAMGYKDYGLKGVADKFLDWAGDPRGFEKRTKEMG